MAESTVTFFAERLSNLILQEASVFGQVEGQVKLLRNELEWMRLFLRDADSKRIYDYRIKLWVDQIRSATHDAEDVIDEFILNVDRRRQRLDAFKLLKCLPACVGFADKLPFIHELDSRVKDINLLIQAIMDNRSKYGLESLEASRTSTNEVGSRKENRPLVIEKSEAVGIEDGDAVVKQMLMKSETLGTVVSVVGMGGLGKTTLAKKVYSQRDVQQHFDCKAWVYVSQEFGAEEILLHISRSVLPLNNKEKEKLKNLREHELGEKLWKYLEDKKYLIVLDDVWSNEVWSSMCSFFPEAIAGSRVLITTRNKDVALHATSQSFIYELRLMTDDESWELFLRKAFQGTSTPCPLIGDLEELGKQIVGKCKGLPLAIVVLGGLLSTKERSKASWEKVFASMEWHLNSGPESCMGILALSYDDLPYYLKSCFVYCGIFPEDYEISASKLINLWMAEGFIQKRGKETPEDIAEDYLQELIHRSLIQVAGRGLDGSVQSCRMHDLLRDLAVSEAKDAKFFEVHKNLDFTYPTSVRRLVIHENPDEKNISQCLHNSQLRSLILLEGPMGKNGWGSLREHIKLLTVLNLGSSDLWRTWNIPREIGQLIYLKFLSIDGKGSVGFLSSIGNLVNLQCLDLGWRKSHIPYSIWKLRRLRHLRCVRGKVSSQSKISKCANGYLGVEQLTNLQTLSLTAGSWLEGDALGKLTQLRQLTLLELSAPHLKKGFFESIAELTLLRALELRTSEGDSRKKTWASHPWLEWQKNVINGEEDAKLFPGLLPFSRHAYLYSLRFQGKLGKLPEQIEFYPPNLLQLTLSRCKIKDDPIIILEKLPLLRILEFYVCLYVGKKMLYSSGGFPRLESLTLERVVDLEEMIIEEGAMSSLKNLNIFYCREMRRLPDGWQHLTNLEILSCAGVSCSESIEEIKEAGGEDWDKLSKILDGDIPGFELYIR